MIDGRAIRKRRKLLGYTQEVLAMRSGLSLRKISRFEQTSRGLSIGEIRDIEKALEKREGGFKVAQVAFEGVEILAIVPTVFKSPGIEHAIMIQPYQIGGVPTAEKIPTIGSTAKLRKTFDFLCEALNQRQIRDIRNSRIKKRKKL